MNDSHAILARVCAEVLRVVRECDRSTYDLFPHDPFTSVLDQRTIREYRDYRVAPVLIPPSIQCKHVDMHRRAGQYPDIPERFGRFTGGRLRRIARYEFSD
jgi:hypothetical protein